MKRILSHLLKEKTNFVFIGEAGCGKSEIAINFAIHLAEISDKPVHFFDMDQTKPLFRSRDVRQLLESKGICFHYEEQLFDAPTVPGGVDACLADRDSIVVMDVGGDHIGARIIGAHAPLLNGPETQNFFVINAYRPWSKDLVSIDGTMARVLGMARIDLANVSFMSNPNLGLTTTAEEVISGNEKVKNIIGEYVNIDYLCALEELCPKIEGRVESTLLPLRLYLTYEWNQ